LVKGYSFRRVGAGVIAASLLAVAAFAPGASAANTRFVYVGSAAPTTALCTAAANDPAGVGSLTTTPFSRGGQFKVDAYFVNCGGQNLSNIQFSVGEATYDADGHLVLDVLADAFDTGDGITINESLSKIPTGLKCNSLPTSLLSCSLKALKPGIANGIFVSLVFTTTTTGTGDNVFVAGKAAENTNDGGSNQDTFEAITGLTPVAGTCDSVTTLFSPKNPNAETCDLGTGNPQSTKVKYTEQVLPVAVSEDSPSQGNIPDSEFAKCVSDKGIQVGKDVNADIDGEGTNDPVTWTITFDLRALGFSNGIKASDLTVCHWDDSGTYDPPIAGSVTITVRQGIATVTFQTAGNGKGKVFI
jgi:hypothetical protein